MALELQRGAHQAAERRDDGAELHGAGQRRIGLGAVLGLLVQRDQLGGHGHQGAPLLVERHLLALAGEQLALEVGLQGAHLQAHGHLGQAHAMSGRGERTFGGYGQKCAKNPQAWHKWFSFKRRKKVQLSQNAFYHQNWNLQPCKPH
ncbi:hypothetical protein D3C78_1062920 [compost metagenome]